MLLKSGGSSAFSASAAREGERVADLERRRIIELADRRAHRLDDLAPAVPRIDAPQPGRAVEHLPPLGREIMHALGAREKHRRLFELAVGVNGIHHAERSMFVTPSG